MLQHICLLWAILRLTPRSSSRVEGKLFTKDSTVLLACRSMQLHQETPHTFAHFTRRPARLSVFLNPSCLNPPNNTKYGGHSTAPLQRADEMVHIMSHAVGVGL